MTVNFVLTNEDAPIDGYKLARLASVSDAPSLVRSAVDTEAGPSDGVLIGSWITEALDGTDLTAAAWTVRVWAKQSATAAKAALRFQVYQFNNAEAGSALLDHNPGTALATTTRDVAQTTANADVTVLAAGDRLVFKLLTDDETGETMVAGYTVTVSYNGQSPQAEGHSYITCPDALALLAAMPAATRTQVRRNLQDTSSSNPLLSNDEIDQAFDIALREYSSDRPQEITDYLSGDGSSYKFVLPRRWIHGFSRIVELEYPHDSSDDQTRNLLEPNDYEVRESSLGPQPLRQLAFKAHTPDSGTDNIAIVYTTRHVHNDQGSTIPAEDFDALCWLASSNAALTLAAKMAASSDSTIAADSVQHRDGEQRWRSVAKEHKAKYDVHIKGDDKVQAAGAVVDWDTSMSDKADMLYHRRRLR